MLSFIFLKAVPRTSSKTLDPDSNRLLVLSIPWIITDRNLHQQSKWPSPFGRYSSQYAERSSTSFGVRCQAFGTVWIFMWQWPWPPPSAWDLRHQYHSMLPTFHNILYIYWLINRLQHVNQFCYHIYWDRRAVLQLGLVAFSSSLIITLRVSHRHTLLHSDPFEFHITLWALDIHLPSGKFLDSAGNCTGCIYYSLLVLWLHWTSWGEALDIICWLLDVPTGLPYPIGWMMESDHAFQYFNIWWLHKKWIVLTNHHVVP